MRVCLVIVVLNLNIHVTQRGNLGNLYYQESRKKNQCCRCIRFLNLSCCIPTFFFFCVGSSLTGVKTSWFKNSGRKSIPQLLLVLATTSSIDDIVDPSRVMRDRGVRIESVGIGSGFDGTQLKEIATHPARDHVMAVSKFDLLPMIRPLLTFRMCRGKLNLKLITSGIDLLGYFDFQIYISRYNREL